MMMGFGCEEQGMLPEAPAEGAPEAEGGSSSSPLTGSDLKVPAPILKFADELNMAVLQTKSQRKFGPARYVDCGWEPERGSELFVGRIPWDCDERELVPFLEQAGSIFQIRLMIDLKNSADGLRCRGYCFVKYFSPAQAQVALSMLHNTCIRENWAVVVNESMENTRLLLFGVPSYISAQQAAQEMSKFGAVLQVELVCEPATHPQATALVTFVNHRVAAGARKRMLELTPLMLWGQMICVDWAEPEELVHPLPLHPDQVCMNLVPEGSYQIIEAPALPTLAPEPVYYQSPIQPVYHPLIPIYSCVPGTSGAEMSGQGAVLVAFFAPPPPTIYTPVQAVPAVEMFWYPPQGAVGVAEQVYCEGCGQCGANDSNA